MILEWIRFAISAVLLLTGLFFFVSEVIGAYRFGFVMNRMHAAGIGDSAGIFFIVASVAVATGVSMTSAKLMLLVFFMWFTSPVSTHFLGQVEYFTNPLLARHVSRLVRPEDAQAASKSADTVSGAIHTQEGVDDALD